jgi:hypothetical protein
MPKTFTSSGAVKSSSSLLRRIPVSPATTWAPKGPFTVVVSDTTLPS